MSRLFWAQLLTYRSMFLLGGLWFGLICVSAVAYNRLMFTEPPISEAAPATAERVAPPTVVFRDQLPQAPDASPLSPDQEAVTESSSRRFSGGITTWGLLSLVGLCSFGCFVIAQQAKAPPRPVRRKRRPTAKRRPTPKLPPQPKRLSPYSPQRDGVVVPGKAALEAAIAADQPKPEAALVRAQINGSERNGSERNGSGVQPVPPTSSGAPSEVPPGAPLATSPAGPHQPMVIPDNEALPLDWSEASIAHTLDLRQRRSLSSLM
ncbi:hypothetical protein [Nodosilinea sp. P-1105]|uniref:hypothetical protein n=1 Tax=Nodosilinea sp. P-1105 TaxID=2546229 RepID=UPI00146EC410|nr:hypothetical protein [Nodosilinea sp. P-1105]NMF85718.1 hypothetical protein [Nodosilinea sp. P-1105]